MIRVGPQEAILHMYSPVWNNDFSILEVMRGACCGRAECVCVCVCVPGNGWYEFYHADLSH